MAAYQRAAGLQVILHPDRVDLHDPSAATGEWWGSDWDEVDCHWQEGAWGHYDAARDIVYLRAPEPGGRSWYTGWHEAIHSTQTAGRLDRFDAQQVQAALSRPGAPGRDRAFAQLRREELTAELGAVLLGQQTGTVAPEHLDVAAARIAHWLDWPGLGSPDARDVLVTSALADATTAADYVLAPGLQAVRDGYPADPGPGVWDELAVASLDREAV